MRRWGWLWIPACVCLFACGCDKHPAKKPDATKGAVSGVVICADTGKPARFATVNLVAVPKKDAKADEQAPATEAFVYKTVALTRLVCPSANLPSTTALATIDPARGRELGLTRGANIVMPNVTPPQYRVLYEIYPGKACIHETAQVCHGCMERRILSIGRRLGTGPGSSPRFAARG